MSRCLHDRPPPEEVKGKHCLFLTQPERVGDEDAERDGDHDEQGDDGPSRPGVADAAVLEGEADAAEEAQCDHRRDPVDEKDELAPVRTRVGLGAESGARLKEAERAGHELAGRRSMNRHAQQEPKPSEATHWEL